MLYHFVNTYEVDIVVLFMSSARAATIREREGATIGRHVGKESR